METYADYQAQKRLIVGRCRKCHRLVRAGALWMPQDPNYLNVYLGLLGIHYEKSKPRDLLGWLKWRKDPERNCMGYVPLGHPSEQAAFLLLGVSMCFWVGVYIESLISFSIYSSLHGLGLAIGAFWAFLWFIIPDGREAFEIVAQATRLFRVEGRVHE